MKRKLLRFCIIGILLYLLFLKVNPTELWEVIKKTKLQYLIYAWCINLPFLFLKTYKWQLLVQIFGSIKFFEVMKAFFVGLTFGVMTPGRSGELGRVLYLQEESRLKLTTTVAVDKALDLISLLAIATIGIGWLVDAHLILLFILITILSFLSIFYLPILGSFLLGHNIKLFSSCKLRELLQGITSFHPSVLLANFCLSILVFLLTLFQAHLLFWGMGNPNLKAVLFAFPIIILSTGLPITIAGLGVREGTAILMLTPFGIKEESAALVSFLLFIINTFMPALIGCFFAVQLNINLKKERLLKWRDKTTHYPTISSLPESIESAENTSGNSKA